MLETLEKRLGRLHARQRLGIEKDHEAQIFGQGNRGDSGDLYPFNNIRKIGKTTKPPSNLPDGKWSGVTITVKSMAGPETMTVDIELA